MDRPNVLVIMTDEERYPPPTSPRRSRRFRTSSCRPGSRSERVGSSSTATMPARRRACRAGRRFSPGSTHRLHGGQPPTAGQEERPTPRCSWLDPDSVPTLGDWFRAGGYETHYRGKWHISHADLVIPGATSRLMASDDGGPLIPEAIDAYRRADRLDPFGFSGWIGREPHGAAKPMRRRPGRRLRRTGGRAVRPAGGGRGATARGSPSRRSSTRTTSPSAASVGSSCSDSARPTTPCPTSPRRRPSATRSPAARPARRRSRLCGRGCSTNRPPTSPTVGSTTTCTSSSTSPSGGSSRPSRPRDVRRHHRGVHLGPRRPHRRARRTGPEVVQRVRRGDRVPLIGPRRGAPSPGHPVPTSHVDLIPTLLGLAGIDLEQATAGVSPTTRRRTPSRVGT